MAVTMRLVGAVKLAPFVGLVIATVGGVLVMAEIVMFTGAEVLEAPRLSVATAVNTRVPATLKGQVTL